MEYSAVLGPDDVLSEKPFTDAANTMREVDVMRHMLLHERERALEWVDIDPGSHTIREHDEEGHRHLIVIPDDVAARVDVDPLKGSLALVEEHVPHHVDLAHRVGGVREGLVRKDFVRPEDR